MKKFSMQVIYETWQIPSNEILEFKKKTSDYCVCIPVLNEGQKILKQLKATKKYLNLVDLVICDWGSSDGSTTPSILRNLGVRTLLTKKEKKGKQAAQLRIGFSYALKQGYKGIIQVDGNNKDGINAIPRFIKELENGYDYVQGSRFVKGGKAINTPLKRWLGIRFITSPILSLASGYWYTDITNGFRAYSRKYLLHPKVKPFRNVFTQYALNYYLCIRANQLGLKTKEIPVTRKYPKGKVVTKINGISKEFDLLFEVIKSALGYYHPKS